MCTVYVKGAIITPLTLSLRAYELRCAKQIRDDEDFFFEGENCYLLKGGIFVYCTVVFLFMKLKLTHDKSVCLDALVDLKTPFRVKEALRNKNTTAVLTF